MFLDISLGSWTDGGRRVGGKMSTVQLYQWVCIKLRLKDLMMHTKSTVELDTQFSHTDVKFERSHLLAPWWLLGHISTMSTITIIQLASTWYRSIEQCALSIPHLYTKPFQPLCTLTLVTGTHLLSHKAQKLKLKSHDQSHNLFIQKEYN